MTQIDTDSGALGSDLGASLCEAVTGAYFVDTYQVLLQHLI
jgi:hypothetical protein